MTSTARRPSDLIIPGVLALILIGAGAFLWHRDAQLEDEVPVVADPDPSTEPKREPSRVPPSVRKRAETEARTESRVVSAQGAAPLRLSGRVVDPQGRGIARAELVLRTTQGAIHAGATSDGRGTFFLRAAQGFGLTLVASAPGYCMVVESPFVLGGAASPREREIVLAPRPLPLHRVVEVGTERPLADVLVTFVSRSFVSRRSGVERRSHHRSDEDGFVRMPYFDLNRNVSFPGVVPLHALDATKKGYAFDRIDPGVVHGGSKEAPLEFRRIYMKKRAAQRLSVRVVEHPGGNPVAGVTLQLTQGRVAAPLKGVTDRRGRVVFKVTRGGPYALHLESFEQVVAPRRNARGKVVSRREDFGVGVPVLIDEADEEFTLTVEKSRRLRGRVLDSDTWRPAVGVALVCETAFLSDPSEVPPERAVTDSEGRFEFRGIGGSPRMIRVVGEDWTFDGKANAEKHPMSFRNQRRVTFHRLQDQLWWGRLLEVFWLADYAAGEVEEPLLVRRLGQIRGRVIDHESRPVPHAEISLDEAQRLPISMRVATTRDRSRACSDVEGRFVLKGLPLGENLRLWISPPGAPAGATAPQRAWPDERSPEKTFRVGPPRDVLVMVMKGDEEPLAGATVVLSYRADPEARFPSLQTVVEAVTNASGEARFRAPPRGVADLTAYAPPALSWLPGIPRFETRRRLDLRGDEDESLRVVFPAR